MLKVNSQKDPLFFFEISESSAAQKKPTHEPSAGQVPHHYHNYYEFYYLDSGRCRYFINNSVYDLIPGDVVMIPKGVIHKTAYDSPDYKRKLICCSSRYIPPSVGRLLPSLPNVYRNENRDPSVKECIERIETEYSSSLPFRDEALYGLFQTFILTLVRELLKTTPIPSTDARITEILNYVRSNYKSRLTLDEVSLHFSLTSEHFSRLFKKETGLNFSEYRTMLRLQEAERLLRGGLRMSITEIAEESGFNDSNYFSQKFKEYYGVPPSKLGKK